MFLNFVGFDKTGFFFALDFHSMLLYNLMEHSEKVNEKYKVFLPQNELQQYQELSREWSIGQASITSLLFAFSISRFFH